MNELKIFESPDFGKVRTMEIDGEPYFVGKDVAEILEYTNPRKALIDHVDSEDKGVTKCDTLGGTQEMTVINESGLYSLILSSKLPKAKEFKRWVTSEVLPSIRKHGAYAVDELINDPELAIKAFTALKEERLKNKKLETTVAVQTQQIAELQPKASYYDVVLNCKDLISTTEIAKDYGNRRCGSMLICMKGKYSSSRAAYGSCMPSMPKRVTPIPRPRRTTVMTVIPTLKCIPIGRRKAGCSFTICSNLRGLPHLSSNKPISNITHYLSRNQDRKEEIMDKNYPTREMMSESGRRIILVNEPSPEIMAKCLKRIIDKKLLEAAKEKAGVK